LPMQQFFDFAENVVRNSAKTSYDFIFCAILMLIEKFEK